MNQPTTAEWSAQFSRQARWTRMTRSQLYRRANLMQAERILDVGCGTGEITRELTQRTRGQVIGLDINPEMIASARRETARTRYRVGDALDLPFPDTHFDLVTCHFLLMWVSDPLLAVREMSRVVRRGGCVLVCAEPDYGGRLDWPELPIRQWQIDGLRRQGAHPLVGRQLRQLSVNAGLRTEVGVIPSHWDAQSLYENFCSEWKWLQHDVGDAVARPAFLRAKAQAKAAIEAGTRLVYIPIFYALGRK